MCRRLLILLMAVLLPGGFVRGSDARPSIVLVIGEDMGPDTGAYGRKDAITPNMDNDTVSHESQVRASDAEHAKNTAALKPSDRRDLAKVELPLLSRHKTIGSRL